MQDQRANPRRTIDTEIRVGDIEGHGEMRLDAGDLSTGGVFLRSGLLFDPGEVLDLTFTVPGADRAVTTRGRVVWASRGGEDHPAGMGLAFEDLSEGDQAALEDWLRVGPDPS